MCPSRWCTEAKYAYHDYSVSNTKQFRTVSIKAATFLFLRSPAVDDNASGQVQCFIVFFSALTLPYGLEGQLNHTKYLCHYHRSELHKTWREFHLDITVTRKVREKVYWRLLVLKTLYPVVGILLQQLSTGNLPYQTQRDWSVNNVAGFWLFTAQLSAPFVGQIKLKYQFGWESTELKLFLSKLYITGQS